MHNLSHNPSAIRSVGILGCGPNLPHNWDDTMYPDRDLVIGINTASETYQVDVVAYLDAKMGTRIEWHSPLRVMTTREIFAQVYADVSDEQRPILTPIEGLNKLANYTAPKVILTTRRLLPEAEIHLYGIDMEGDAYHDGSVWMPHRPDRDKILGKIKARWAKEREILADELKNPLTIQHS
jgi:hypothetical protein